MGPEAAGHDYQMCIRDREQPMPERLQELTRRAFIFSCFTGLSYVDVNRLYPSHIGITLDGRRYIRINRKKTDVESFIPIHPIAGYIYSMSREQNLSCRT